MSTTPVLSEVQSRIATMRGALSNLLLAVDFRFHVAVLSSYHEGRVAGMLCAVSVAMQSFPILVQAKQLHCSV